MEDDELLQLAAKSVGLNIQWSNNVGDWSAGEPYTSSDKRWNPITDNNDAFSLAVKLRLEINIGTELTTAHTKPADENYKRFSCSHDGDDEYATRFAIVMVAAKIGQSISAGNTSDQT